MIDAHRDYGDETTVVDDIEHLDFDVTCDRKRAGCRNEGTVAVRLSTVHGCAFDSWRGIFCEDCTHVVGFCASCGASDHYEVIS